MKAKLFRITFHQSFLFCALAFVLHGCVNTDSVTENKKQNSNPAQPVELAVVIAAPRPVSSQLMIPGVVSALPDHSIKITPSVSGKLISVFVVPGQRVARSQLIAQLDDRHIADQLEQAKAAVQIAQANLRQTTDNLSFAKDNLERQKKLFDAEVSAKKDIIAAENQVQVAASQLTTAQSQVKSAQATARQMQTELSFTRVHSPIEGIIANRYLNAGDTVDLNTPIAQVVDMRTVIINATLPADSTENIQTRQKAEVCSIANPETVFGGMVIAVSPIVDSQSNSIRIQVRCNNYKEELREGQAVNTFIDIGKEKTAILVPQAALVPNPEKPDQSMIYILQDGKAKRIPVAVGISENKEVEIRKGLNGGEQVIIEGVYGLPDGTEITPRQTPKR